jgi:hypothetical protein
MPASEQEGGQPDPSPRPGLLRLLADERVALDLSGAESELRDLQKGVLEQKKAVTERISESSRTLAFGALASCYALLIAEPQLAASFGSVRPLLFGAAGLGIAAIVVDAAQYVFAYICIQQALCAPDQLYPTNWTRRGRTICFLLKQLLAYLAALLLLIGVVIVIFRAPATSSAEAHPLGAGSARGEAPPAPAPGTRVVE